MCHAQHPREGPTAPFLLPQQSQCTLPSTRGTVSGVKTAAGKRTHSSLHAKLLISKQATQSEPYIVHNPPGKEDAGLHQDPTRAWLPPTPLLPPRSPFPQPPALPGSPLQPCPAPGLGLPSPKLRAPAGGGGSPAAAPVPLRAARIRLRGSPGRSREVAEPPLAARSPPGRSPRTLSRRPPPSLRSAPPSPLPVGGVRRCGVPPAPSSLPLPRFVPLGGAEEERGGWRAPAAIMAAGPSCAMARP